MMDRNYPISSFADPLVPPAQTAAWAYERSTASVKPSLNYGATHPESELLHRQTYASIPQLPSYATAHHPIGLSGIFDTSLHTAGSNTTEASVMSFLSTIESRSPQAGPATASLLPQFRTPSWQTGINSSAATERFITGALPSSGTFPTPSPLSTYQHPNTFSSRGFTTAPSLAIQDPTFSPSTNGLMSPHDPLLPMKSIQGTVSTALTYDRLASTALTVSIPPQSSTYRSAQESAPHLLQPQFAPLPLGLVSQQQAPQPFSTSVFTSSIERALQRECSVIKHHQRPSSTQSVQTQLRNATQHSLQSYLTGRNEAPFPDPSQQPDIPSSLIADSTQVSSGGLQQKTTQAALEQTQAYSSVPSPRFSPVSSVKAKDCPSEKKQLPADITESQRASPDQLSQSYPSPTQKQSSVIAHQSQAYSPTQMPSLMSESSSQSYVASQNLTSSISHPQVYSSSQSEKLPSLYKTLTSFAGQSGNVSSVSQSLIYSSSQQQTLPSAVHSEDYGIQVQALDPGNPSQSYSSSLSQGLPTVSYSAQSQGLVTVSPSQTYASGQSSSLTLQSLSFPSSRALNLPTQRSTQDYVLTQPSPGAGKAEDTLSPQPQKYLTPVQSPLFPSTLQSQALPNNRSSADLESPYCKRKLNSDVFVTTKQEVCEFPIQDLQTLQQTALDASAENLVGADMGVQSHVLYVVSKMDDRYNSQSVIRSNSRPEDHMVDMELPESKKEDSTSHYRQHVTNANSQGVSDIKGNSSHTQSSHGAINAEELKTHSLRHKALDCGPQSHHMEAGSTRQQGPDQPDQQGQFIRLSSAQVLMEPPRDLPMILLQRSILHPGVDPSKVSAQSQQVSVQYLELDDQIASASVGQSQQQLTLPENPEILKMDLAETSKPLQQHMMPKDNYSQPNHHDTKHHFALSSICFPDSMLLADDRNILANVDDILAATAAACGVTPQDFVKATSSEGEMPMLASRVDSNGHFQLVDARHISPSFSSQNSAIANIQPVTMTQNNSQMALGIHSFSKGAVLEQQGLQMVNSHTDPGLAASINSSMGEKMVKCSSRSDESEGENEEVLDMQRVHSNGMDYNTTGRSNSKESSPPPENDFHLADQGNDHVQSGEEKRVKIEDAVRNSPNNGYPKKKPKYKGSAKLVGEEEDGQPKPVKRSGHGKRQNSRGTDTSSPSTSDSCYDGYQQQERMRQKIREVEEKQPEVKTGFIGSFLDFLKSGPKQQFSSPPMRMPNRTRKPSSSSRRPPCPLPLTFRPHQPPTPLMSPEPNGLSPSKRLDEELKKNLETLPSFSSDEEDSMGKNQDLQKSINSALFVLDQPAERRNKLEKGPPSETTKPDLPKSPSMPPSALKAQELTQTAAELSVKDFLKDVPLDELALQLTSVAIEGLTDEDLSDSGGEGMYRERDEFVVKIEDIECLKMTLKAGKEPPAIWKVQKALLQKFVPELRDGTRVFSATNSYLGYFGDAKTMYRRVYVKFIDTVNKREYVRVCNRKPRCKPMHSIRGSQGKSLHGPKAASVTSAAKPVPSRLSSRPKAKQPKVRAEPPPKKRKKWKEEFSSSLSESSPEVVSQDDEFTPPVPFASRFLNTRTMKETFKCFVELLISMAMDADMMEARERENDELLLPHVKKVDGMITDNRRRLLPKLRVGQLFKSALDSFPELSLVTELKKDGETPSFKVRLSGKAYNKRTMKPSKASSKLPLEYTVDKEKTQWISLYHSLQHYKYHTYLLCKDEITSLKTRGEDLGQEEMVQLCLRDGEWVESLFDKFGQLLTQVQQTCL